MGSPQAELRDLGLGGQGMGGGGADCGVGPFLEPFPWDFSSVSP